MAEPEVYGKMAARRLPGLYGYFAFSAGAQRFEKEFITFVFICLGTLLHLHGGTIFFWERD